MVSCTPRLLYPRYLLNERLDRPEEMRWMFWEQKNPLLLSATDPRFLGRPTRSPVNVSPNN